MEKSNNSHVEVNVGHAVSIAIGFVENSEVIIAIGYPILHYPLSNILHLVTVLVED